jgi:hypothetical protein
MKLREKFEWAARGAIVGTAIGALVLSSPSLFLAALIGSCSLLVLRETLSSDSAENLLTADERVRLAEIIADDKKNAKPLSPDVWTKGLREALEPKLKK